MLIDTMQFAIQSFLDGRCSALRHAPLLLVQNFLAWIFQKQPWPTMNTFAIAVVHIFLVHASAKLSYSVQFSAVEHLAELLEFVLAIRVFVFTSGFSFLLFLK